jgi:hypothetical protein
MRTDTDKNSSIINYTTWMNNRYYLITQSETVEHNTVKFINDGGVDGIKKDLERLLTASENIFKRISSVLTELNEIKHI